jgi:hypothetical protein
MDAAQNGTVRFHSSPRVIESSNLLLRTVNSTVYMPSPSGYSAVIPSAASSASLLGAPYPFGPPVYQPPPLTGCNDTQQ